MKPTTGARHFAGQARENRLHISVDDAAALGSFAAAVDAAYSTIREIDATGFEPAAILVPTPSGDGAATPSKKPGRETD